MALHLAWSGASACSLRESLPNQSIKDIRGCGPALRQEVEVRVQPDCVHNPFCVKILPGTLRARQVNVIIILLKQVEAGKLV